MSEYVELINGTMKPLAIDLFCGLGGWTEGLLAEGYYVVGFDIEYTVNPQLAFNHIFKA